MAEGEWSRLLRRAFAAWSVVSATGGMLLSTFRFLSVHGQLTPSIDAGTGTLTIVVNACLLTTCILMDGFIAGFFFLYLSIRVVETGDIEMFIVGIVVRLFALASGIVLLFHGDVSGSKLADRIFGAMCLAAIVLYLSPAARWIAKRSEQTMILAGSIVTTVVLTSPALMRSSWRVFLSGSGYDAIARRAGRNFTIIPLSSMTVGLWFFAAFGAAIWVEAYVAFQEWRTRKGVEYKD